MCVTWCNEKHTHLVPRLHHLVLGGEVDPELEALLDAALLHKLIAGHLRVNHPCRQRKENVTGRLGRHIHMGPQSRQATGPKSLSCLEDA